jgi:hypothetical protein
MATIGSVSLPSPAQRRVGQSHPFAGMRAFFNAFFAKVLDPYRPELHYMRGPGPACRAKRAATLRVAH